MRPMAAAAVGALIAGVAMYAVGTRAQDNFFADAPALVQAVDGQYIQVPGARRLGFVNALQPATAPLVVQQRTIPVQAPAQRTVYTSAQPAQERVVVPEARSKRSWGKTALIIGGSAAGGAGVGAAVGGKKGALAGAAIGGGAASIYEAIKR